MTESKGSGYRAIIIITVFFCLIAGLIYWKSSSQGSPKGPVGAGSPGGKPKAQMASGFIAKSQNIPINLESSGNLLAWDEVQLTAEMGGKITQMNIQEGIEVTKGQLLIKLFDEDLRAQMRKQELQAKIAQKNLERLKELLKINAVSQQEIDNAENQANNIQSEIDLLKANLKKTEIIAPFSGRIGLTNASLGAYVSPGTTLASLQNLGVLKIEFSIPEKYSSQLLTNDLVKFTVESQPDTFLGKVYAFEPKINIANRSLNVRAKFENKGGRLLPGSFARVAVKLREIKGAVMVPNECIIPDTRGKKVIVYKNGMAEFTTVETGIRNVDLIQVVKGISAGDTIVQTGLMFVKPNTAVQLTKVQ